MKMNGIWQAVKKKCIEKGIPVRYLETTRREMSSMVTHEGQPLAWLDHEQTEILLRVLVARVEESCLRSRLDVARQSGMLAARELGIKLAENLGIDEERIKLDPETGAVYCGKDSTGDGPASETYHRTLKGYGSLLEQAMESPLVAHRMVNDGILPQWLRDAARVLVSGGLKPAIRCALEDALADPDHAATLYQGGIEMGWPGWLIDTLEVLSGQGINGSHRRIRMQ